MSLLPSMKLQEEADRCPPASDKRGDSCPSQIALATSNAPSPVKNTRNISFTQFSHYFMNESNSVDKRLENVNVLEVGVEERKVAKYYSLPDFNRARSL